MGDSMEEELDSGGAVVVNCGGSHIFTSPRDSTGHATSAPTASIPAVPGGLLRGSSETWPEVWARKRGRSGLEGGKDASAGVNWGMAMNGGHIPPTRGRESPDSDMSSSGSDVSINKGIKRMRLDQHKLEQHHRQHQHRQQQHDQQGRHPPSAFGLFSSGHGGRPSLAWGAMASAAAGEIAALRRQPTEVAPDVENPPFSNNLARSIATPIPLGHSVTLPTGVQQHPHLLPISERSLSDDFSSMGDATGGPISYTDVIQSGAEGPGPIERHGGRVRGHHAPGPPAPSNCCAEFPPFSPRPPAQARYVRGIRVQTDAPADVNYSNVNHALRQLHMERRMMAAAREAAGGRAEAGRQEIGDAGHPRR